LATADRRCFAGCGMMWLVHSSVRTRLKRGKPGPGQWDIMTVFVGEELNVHACILILLVLPHSNPTAS
jgi:hypothetical protein